MSFYKSKLKKFFEEKICIFNPSKLIFIIHRDLNLFGLLIIHCYKLKMLLQKCSLHNQRLLYNIYYYASTNRNIIMLRI